MVNRLKGPAAYWPAALQFALGLAQGLVWGALILAVALRLTA
jgi:hypothetical protein